MNESTLDRVALKAVGLMDLTSLNESDSEQSIAALCQQAITPVGTVAAVCVYPRFIGTVAESLRRLNVSERVAIASVVNFPHGNHSIGQVEQEITAAVLAGANEIDLVLPYRQLMAGDETFALAMVRAARVACHGAILKVIIESGELGSPALIARASELAISGGADFIKTSTGKVAVNATLPAAEVMLKSILASGKDVGFKAAGGVRTTADAQQYLQLATRIMGPDWVTPAHFRFGASSLLDQLLHTLDGRPGASSGEGY
ncbi:deoxyribose-phosphate aldolase [Oceanisphaera sp.]|uniref:deoxyribose-phosphate aldolase n=1 Tax=Oceanisphaera sp. TaxID=1929979 RepID=UPI003A95D304